ncbi:MAG: nucleotidyltransferase domain-containing protein [Candidatus Nanohaloarchaea archaeon]
MSPTTKTSEKKNFMDLLATDYKQEVLEVLLDKPGYMFTVNELANNVSGSYNSVNKFLRQLEEFDIVSFQKKGGSHLVQYNQDSRYHNVIKTLLRADNKPLEEAAEKYAEKLYSDLGLEDQIKSILLFGSVARGTAGPNSDIDILVLVDEDADVGKIKNKARNQAQKVQLEYEVVPVVENVKEFKDNLENGKRFETNVKKDGIVLKGEELEFKD